MSWQDILKMPNPYGGKWAGLTREQYYEMSDKDKKHYHGAMVSATVKLIKTLRARNQPFDAPTETVKNELKALQEKRNFHGRQYQRLREGEMEAYFNMEDEGNYESRRLVTTPMGNTLEDLTEEEYNAAARGEKYNYHLRRHRSGKKGHAALSSRMENHPNYIAPYNPKDANINTYMVRETKEEYENMDIDEKRKYHRKLKSYYYRSGNLELGKFHQKMHERIRRDSSLKTYYSPEDEQNGS